MEFGWIEGTQKNKVIVVPINGKNQFLAENRIAFSWKDKELPLNSTMAHESLKFQINEAKQFMGTCELETMHSLLDEIREYSIDELAENFLDNPKRSVHRLGLFFSLRENSFWFKHNRNLTYTPRTQEELENLRVQLTRQKDSKEYSEKVKAWIKLLETDKWGTESKISTKQKNWIDQLLNLLVEGTESKFWKEFSSALGWGASFGNTEEKSLLKWLCNAGNPVSRSRLILLRANVHEQFGENIYKEVERIQKLNKEKTKEIQLEIPTFTIDAKKTKDYDDAFSVIEWNNDSLKIEVHITDLSYNVNPKSSIFKEAESRISSVYTLEKSFPMLPEELSNDLFSLKANKFRKVLSFIFKLSSNGYWKLLEIEERNIKVLENLSYEKANKLIKGKKDFWDLLYQFCLKSQEKRIDNGALNISRKEFDFEISDPKNIRITSINRNSPANLIIEEIAISVNRETGRLFQESEFPGIYRTQSSYEIIKEVEEGDQLSMEHLRLNPTRLTTFPEKHAGLGCNSYIQVTSPMRRFVDLIMQLQLKLLISNKEPVFNKDDLLRWSEIISIRQKKYKRAEIEILKFWKLKYLEQNLGDFFDAKTGKTHKNGNTDIKILVIDYTVPASGLGKLKEGEKLILQIKEIQFFPPRLGVRRVTTEKRIICHSLKNNLSD